MFQKNVDEAVGKLKARGIEVLGVVCHVSNAQQRRNLIDNALQVRTLATYSHYFSLIVFAFFFFLSKSCDNYCCFWFEGLFSRNRRPTDYLYIWHKFVRSINNDDLQKYGKIDVVVSNAAVNPIADYAKDTILKIQDSALDKMWDVNIKACVLLLKVNIHGRHM